MLSTQELASWGNKLELPERTIELIERVRTSDPFRAVQSRCRNVKGKYPSHKMGRTIQFESQTAELPFIHQLERDNSALEFYDQPSERVKLKYKAGINEKVIGFTHTPDFFVISKDEAGWVECKTEKDLLELAADSPNRYLRVDGQWRCPPGEAYAEQFGLYYRVVSSKDFSWILERNYDFLDDYYLEARRDIPVEAKDKIDY